MGHLKSATQNKLEKWSCWVFADKCSISKDFPHCGLAPAQTDELFLLSISLVLPIKYFSKQTNKQNFLKWVSCNLTWLIRISLVITKMEPHLSYNTQQISYHNFHPIIASLDSTLPTPEESFFQEFPPALWELVVH